MGHYDSCYAYDYAVKQVVTQEHISNLENRVKKEGEIHGYYDDYGDTFLTFVVDKSDILETKNTGHGMFKIVLKEEPKVSKRLKLRKK